MCSVNHINMHVHTHEYMYIHMYYDLLSKDTCMLGFFLVFLFVCLFFLHHNIVYSKSPVYNNLNGPGVNIKGPMYVNNKVIL